jgi:hypothetical protein
VLDAVLGGVDSIPLGSYWHGAAVTWRANSSALAAGSSLSLCADAA